MKSVFFVIFLTFLLSLTTLAAPPADEGGENVSEDAKTIDNTTYINANKILMFVTNHGNFGRDLNDLFGYDAGTFYPYNTIEDIQSGILNNFALFAAGPWIAGKINGELRVAVAEYCDEYVPGPMKDGTFQPDNPTFKVYKLYKDSLESNPNDDYLNWPVDQGAPVDERGKPLMLGDQMLWTVYNDADRQQHDNNSGDTEPLGIEIQQTIWAIDEPGEIEATPSPNITSGPDGVSIYIKYKLFNKGGDTIDSCYFSLWSDPDLGDLTDDLVGCDTLEDIFFCYNATNDDAQYGALPPSIGFKILFGPLAPLPDSAAYFDGSWLTGHKNLGMTSFSKYINGTDPDNAQQTYNYMRGLNRDGTEYTYNGVPTKFFHSGDPVAGTGDLDNAPYDRRMMGTFGPFTFSPGDSQFVSIKMAIGQGTNRLSSITKLKEILSAHPILGYIPGDANNDGAVNVGDVVYIVNHLYHSGPLPLPPDAGDVDCDSVTTLGDAVYLLNYIFRFGPAPCVPEPG